MQPSMSAGMMGTNWNQPNMMMASPMQQQQPPPQQRPQFYSSPQDPFGPITATQQPLF